MKCGEGSAFIKAKGNTDKQDKQRCVVCEEMSCSLEEPSVTVPAEWWLDEIFGR
jgi:hypothetical protein